MFLWVIFFFKYLYTEGSHGTEPASQREPTAAEGTHSPDRQTGPLAAPLPPVGQEGHRPLMPVLVCHRPHAGRLHNDVVDDPCGEQSNRHPRPAAANADNSLNEGRARRPVRSRAAALLPGAPRSHRPGLTSGDEEVGHHHQRVNRHGRGHVHPARPLQLDVGALEHSEGQAVQRLHGGGAAQRTAARSPPRRGRPPPPDTKAETELAAAS